MGYQALLFCPDDKTARTVTQVLSELEFSVEACIEPFAAVKKLMGQHFDAVVVDCDNEQNATLLFKSARNSTSNQTSLAVAVVEGQAGVAKAFRIGANLVLTKPINIEQAKGTLRVARGLLRKSDPAKPGSPTATGSFAPPVPPAAATAAAQAKPVSAKPVSAVKPAAPIASKPLSQVSSLPPKPVQSAKPAAPSSWPTAAASAKPAPGVQNETPTPVGEKSAAPPALYNAAVATPAPQKLSDPAPPETKPHVASSPATSGAASAPAPARETVTPKISEKPAAADLFEKPAEPAHSEPAAYVGSAPSFSFGGTTSDSESSGGNKKVIIGVAAALILAVGSYFAWSHFKGTSSSSAQPVTTSAQPAATSTPVSTPAATKPSSSQPASATTSPIPVPVSQPDVTISKSSSRSDEDSEPSSKASRPSASAKPANASPAPAAPAKPVETEKPEAPALIVKGGKVTAPAKSAPATDAPAPSLIGMGAPTAALPNLGTPDASLKPTLQTLSVSQGVSQGLLYKKVSPSYPQNALRMHIEGKVELLATISKNGDITHIKVLSGDALLTKAASDAVKQWKYKPYLLNGEPVEIQTQVTVNFKLPH